MHSREVLTKQGNLKEGDHYEAIAIVWRIILK
jgi:hypothetical protein